MATLRIEDVSTTGLITVLACWQMANFARAVGAARRKYKVSPPEVNGDPAFLRTFRAQQNCVEFFGLFLGILWMATLFAHQYPASILGALYMFGRHSYFYGYAEDAKKRLRGFALCVLALQGLLIVAAGGLVQTLALQYTNFNCIKFARGLINM